MIVAGAIAGCAAGVDGPADAPRLEGTWQLRGNTTYDDCGEYAPSFPFAPQHVRLDVTEEHLTIVDPTHGLVRFAKSDASQWLRTESIAHEGCEVDLTSRWHIIAMSATQLAAVLDIEAVVSSPACAEFVGHRTTCRIRHAVTGIRP